MAVSMARSEYRRCPPRRPLRPGVQAATASEDSHTVTSRRCCMNTLCRWGGVARTSLDPPQEPHYGNEVEGSSHV